MKNKPCTKEVYKFLKQSNYIEMEYTEEAFEDAIKAWDYLIKQNELNRENILETHRILMERCNPNQVPIGKFRDFNVRVGDRVCPGYMVSKDKKINAAVLVKIRLKILQKIEGLMSEWLQDVYILEESIKKDAPIALGLHVKFEKLHPFGDGNGRIGRIILNWQRVKAGLPILVIYEIDKYDYYKWFS